MITPLTRPRLRRAVRMLASGVALAMVLVACGGDVGTPVFGGPEDLEDLELAEICDLLAEAERPETMPEEAYDGLIASFAAWCAQLGVSLPPLGAPSTGGPGSGGATPGAAGRDGDAADGQRDATRTDSHLILADPFDDDVRRRAIAEGPQCDLAAIEPHLAALESDEVQSAIASTQAFFGELRESGAWDQYDTASPWGRWWDSEQFRELWSDAQWAAARGGGQLPDIPYVP